MALQVDRRQGGGTNQKTQIVRLRAKGIPVEDSGLSRLIHKKCAVISGRAVFSGSFNVMRQVENRHRENVVVLWGKVPDSFWRVTR